MGKLKFLALVWLVKKASSQLTAKEIKSILKDKKENEAYKKAFKKFTKQTKNMWRKR